MLKLPEVRKSAVVANVGRKMRNVVAAVLAAAAMRVCNFLWAARSRLIDVGGDSVTK